MLAIIAKFHAGHLGGVAPHQKRVKRTLQKDPDSRLAVINDPVLTGTLRTAQMKADDLRRNKRCGLSFTQPQKRFVNQSRDC